MPAPILRQANRQWWSKPDTEGHMSRSHQINHDYAPNIRHEPQYFVINTSKAVSAPVKTNLGPGKSSSRIRRRKLRNDLHLGWSSCQNPKARRSVNGLYFGLSSPLSMDMRQPSRSGWSTLGKVHQGRRGYQSRSLAEQASWNYVGEAPIGTKQMAWESGNLRRCWNCPIVNLVLG